MFKILYVIFIGWLLYKFFTKEDEAVADVSGLVFERKGYDLTKLKGELGQPVKSEYCYYKPSSISNIEEDKLKENKIDNKSKKYKDLSKSNLNEEKSSKTETTLIEDDTEVSAPNVIPESFESLNAKKTDSFIDRVTDAFENAQAVFLTELACEQDRLEDEIAKANEFNAFSPSENTYECDCSIFADDYCYHSEEDYY